MKFFEPNITELEALAVYNAVKNGHLSTGVITSEFESKFKEIFGYKYAVATNSGTSALQLALQSMGVGSGDEVVVPAYGIMCTVNAIRSSGATPVFTDIERESYNLDPEKLSEVLTEKTKVVLPFSLFGVPCDVKGIKSRLPEYVKILEDSIECLGSKRDGDYIGKDVEAATFGFFPNKQITTGRGGVVVSSNWNFIRKFISLSDNGYFGPYDLWNPGYGYNMKMPDVNAAIGLAQLSRLEEMQISLRSVKSLLDIRFLPYRKQKLREEDFATEFIYCIELPDGVNKRNFGIEMEKLGIPTRPYFNTLHGGAVSHCKVADLVASKTVALPFHKGITSEDVEEIWVAFQRVVGA